MTCSVFGAHACAWHLYISCHLSASVIDFSVSWHNAEVRENWGDYRKARNFNISFPTTICPPTFHKTNMLHNNLKNYVINEVGIKYWTLNPVIGQISGTSELRLREYWTKGMIIVKKITTYKRLTGRLKLRLLSGIGRFQWNQGKKVIQLAWFGEPWRGCLNLTRLNMVKKHYYIFVCNYFFP